MRQTMLYKLFLLPKSQNEKATLELRFEIFFFLKTVMKIFATYLGPKRWLSLVWEDHKFSTTVE